MTTQTHSQPSESLSDLAYNIHQKVTSYLHGRIQNSSTRRDLGQETLTTWLTKRQENPDIGVGYAINICKNLLKRHYAHQQKLLERNEALVGDEPGGIMPRQHSSLGISEEHRVELMCERLRAAVECFSPQQCQVFELKYVEDLRIHEIAAALEISTSTVDRRLAEIMTIFRSHGAYFEPNNARESLHALRRLLTRFERPSASDDR